MVNDFQKHLEQHFSFLQPKKILIALSGGVDSVVLTHLLHQLGYTIAVAHCNFHLRGNDANKDQAFCEDLAKQLQIPFYTIDFDTKKYIENKKTSIQMGARTLRYEWFEKVMQKNNYDFLATAHHAHDNLETFFINLSRSTGLKGLTGIPEQKEKIIRPLLPFSKDQIKQYAKQQKIAWREDQSNLEEKYIRNQLRLNVIPKLEEITSQFLSQFQKTILHLKSYENLVDSVVKEKLEKVQSIQGEEITFNIPELLKLKPLETYLHLIFNPYGFNEIKDLVNVLKGDSGKQLYNDQYRLVKSRETLFLLKNVAISLEEYVIAEKEVLQNKLTLKPYVNNLDFYREKKVEIDSNELIFPLRLRRKKSGDVFYPLGMKGKKKISKFFKDEKLSIHQKEQVWILENGNKAVIWIVGLRLDHRFKKTINTKNSIKISI